jgi:hypothetical protein
MAYPDTRSVQSLTAAAPVAAHVGFEEAVNVLVANTGQVPLIRKPELAAAVVIEPATIGVAPDRLSAIDVPLLAIVRPVLAGPPAVRPVLNKPA